MAYSDLSAAFVYKNPLSRSTLDQLGFNDAFLKDNGWQTSTKAVFYQTAAPTGWTKDTSNNDKILRVVTGAGGGTGGTKATSTSLTLAHTAHSIASSGTHTHDLAHTHDLGDGASNGTGSGGTPVVVADGSDFLHALTAGANAFNQYQNKMTNASAVTSGADGAHGHGSATTGAALTDVTLQYCDVIVCSKDTSSGYTDQTTAFSHNDKFNFDPFDILAANDDFLNARLMPATSVMIWGQAAAPTGWTKSTSIDAMALRVVSGSGGVTGGGTQDLASAITLAHSHSTSADGAHSHTVPNHICNLDLFGSTNLLAVTAADYVQADGGGILKLSGASGPSASQTCYKRFTNSDGSGNTAASSTHTHTIGTSLSNISIAYLDLIQCSKDSTGAPFAYAALTGTTSWKKLVSKQRLNAYGKNDEYLKYHTVPSTSKTFFFLSAAPLTWTKLATQNDKGLRMVSGGTGGTAGGSQPVSSGIPLAHTHTISSVGHSHGLGTHTHTLASAAATANAIGTNGLGPTSTSSPHTRMLLFSNGGSNNTLANFSNASSSTSDTNTHNHGGATGSLLTDVTYAYIDVIYCTKD